MASDQRFAAGTKVPALQSRIEVEKLLQRAGSRAIGVATTDSQAQLVFELERRQIRMLLQFPTVGGFYVDGRGRRRSPTAAEEARDAEVRRLWRALLLVLKAKLTAIAEGVSTVEREFLPDLVGADGRTVLEVLGPALDASRGTAPPLIPERLSP
jgi:hypothetical protein